jgi:hypothetical protein
LPFFRRSIRRRNMTAGFNHKRTSLEIGVRLSWSPLQPFLTLFPIPRPFEIKYLG